MTSTADMSIGHDPEAKRKIVNRLRRAHGQLAAVIAAVEDEAHCRDIVQQLSAVSKAVDRAGFLVVAGALKEYITNPVVTVIVVETVAPTVFVMGEVTTPGAVAMPANGSLTVLQALALAGGFTRFADPDEVVIVRRDAQGERRIPFVFEEVVGKGDLRGDLPLQTNDTVVVP